MLKLRIVGQATLARAVNDCCLPHFDCRIDSTDVDILWVCYDTPIGEDDVPDNYWVMDKIREDISEIEGDPLILVSSQMPVGTIAQLEREFPSRTFAYSPENIRVASGVADFENQARIVVGRRNAERDDKLMTLFLPFTKKLIFTDPETAEMVKHALNCFLALNITFINEVARICSIVGADVDKITEALRSEQRISPKAPLKAGLPFGGGHLARDIYTLSEIASANNVDVPVIFHITKSNTHRNNAG